MARKINSHPDQIDLTPFMFTASGPRDKKSLGKPGCAGCHPGGGMTEFDRDGKRYDKRLKEDPSLSQSLDGDYYKARWDKTGVVEADCFICHLPAYSNERRNKHLKLLNFKWASVAGSGLGQVYGFVRDGDEPKVVYNKRLFNEDGRIVLPIKSKPPAENCLSCHGWVDMAKRGTTWDDPTNLDVHHIGGLTCVDCHFGDLKHNFAKGDAIISTVRDDLDGSMKSCEECHTLGYMGAPPMKHRSIRVDHLDKLSCQACHIPSLNRSVIGAIVITTGPPVKYPQVGTPKIGTQINWKPAYTSRKHVKEKYVKIFPVNKIAPLFYTNKDADGLYHPLFVREVKKAYGRCAEQLTTKDSNRLDIHTPSDIELMLSTLSQTLVGNKRFKQIKPHFHKGGQVYFLDDKGNLVRKEDDTWAGRTKPFSISHNVTLPGQALGKGGCTDCHAEGSHIFYGKVVSDIFGPEGKPVYVTTGSLIGYDPGPFKWNFWLQYYFTWILPFLVLGFLILVFLLVLHYVGQRPKYTGLYKPTDEAVPGQPDPYLVRQRERAETSTFIFRILTLLFIVLVAHVFIFVDTGMLNLFVSLYRKASVYAWITGFILFVATVVTYVLWVRIKPAVARLSAGQKVLFWLTHLIASVMLATGLLLMIKKDLPLTVNLVSSVMHGLAAVLFLFALMVVTYVGILAIRRRGQKHQPAEESKEQEE